MRLKSSLPCGALLVLLLAGCAPQRSSIPTSISEYGRMGRTDRERFPRRTIVDYNLQRAMNPDISPLERVESLRLVLQLQPNDPQSEYQMATILGDPSSVPQLRKMALEYLLARDHPGLAEYVVRLLPQLKTDSPLRDRIIDWLIKHPQPSVLAEVVKLWAAEPSTTGPNEPRFRRMVETMTGKTWQQALLDAINTPEFFARGSAIEILTHREPPSSVRLWLSRMQPRTVAIQALQTFLERFDYVPQTASQLLHVAWLYGRHKDLLPDAARLARQWRDAYGYRFDVRDTHLLSRLQRDPLRVKLTREQLISHLSRVLSAAPHVRHTPSVKGAVDDYREGFDAQLPELSVVDLWNIYLIREMLGRARIQMALRITAERDREDRQGAWGGLIFYENGQAEAKLYPYSPQGGQNDLLYRPGRQAIVDGRDSMARFCCHFERVDNSLRAGPGPEEIRDAVKNNYYGLILTSVNRNVFCAHYYNPNGIVISLGTFPFR